MHTHTHAHAHTQAHTHTHTHTLIDFLLRGGHISLQRVALSEHRVRLSRALVHFRQLETNKRIK